MQKSFDFLSKEHISYCINFKPFVTIKRYIRAYLNNNVTLIVVLENLLGNFLLFAPMSFLVSYKLKNIGFFKYALALLITIIVIEFLQFFYMIGIADIDDVILNFLGGIISFVIFKKCEKLLEKK